jgi:hypothetical protein
MRTQLFLSRVMVTAIVFGAIWFVLPQSVFAHCDTLDGPVVMTAKKALEKGDVAAVVKWVKKDYEQEIRTAFQKTLAVRAKGPGARELADMYFFETLVRLHRAGEGAPYTGLKAAGAVDPAIAAADRALETGTVDGLVKNITNAMSSGIRERFARAIEKKQHADESIDAGREFVEAYVEFVHYVERLHLGAAGKSIHHAD